MSLQIDTKTLSRLSLSPPLRTMYSCAPSHSEGAVNVNEPSVRISLFALVLVQWVRLWAGFSSITSEWRVESKSWQRFSKCGASAAVSSRARVKWVSKTNARGWVLSGPTSEGRCPHPSFFHFLWHVHDPYQLGWRLCLWIFDTPLGIQHHQYRLDGHPSRGSSQVVALFTVSLNCWSYWPTLQPSDLKELLCSLLSFPLRATAHEDESKFFQASSISSSSPIFIRLHVFFPVWDSLFNSSNVFSTTTELTPTTKRHLYPYPFLPWILDIRHVASYSVRVLSSRSFFDAIEVDPKEEAFLLRDFFCMTSFLYTVDTCTFDDDTVCAACEDPFLIWSTRVLNVDRILRSTNLQNNAVRNKIHEQNRTSRDLLFPVVSGSLCFQFLSKTLTVYCICFSCERYVIFPYQTCT